MSHMDLVMMIIVYKCVVFLVANICLACPNSVEAIVKKRLISVVNESLAVIGYCNPELLSQISCDWVT